MGRAAVCCRNFCIRTERSREELGEARVQRLQCHGAAVWRVDMDLTECTARSAWASKHLAALREAVWAYERSTYQIRQESPRSLHGEHLRHREALAVADFLYGGRRAAQPPLDPRSPGVALVRLQAAQARSFRWETMLTARVGEKVMFPLRSKPPGCGRPVASEAPAKRPSRDQGVSSRDSALCHEG